MTAPAAQQLNRNALARELADFLVELSIALHKHAVYPPAHPLLGTAVQRVERRAARLLQERPTISLGVARRQLVIEGVMTDAANPLLRDLAQRLHDHHLGAIRITRGIVSAELSDALATLAHDARRTAQPVGLRPAELLPRWEHLQLFPVAYDHLELLDGDKAPPLPPEGPGAHVRPNDLWIDLARVALAIEDDAAGIDHTPSAVASAIDHHARDTAYDQVVVGYLLQITDELQIAGNEQSIALQRRVSEMVHALTPSTLRRLLDMAGDLNQRQRFVLEATQGLAVDAVLDVLGAAAEVSQREVSHPLLRVLRKMAVHAEEGPAASRAEAAESVREQVRELVHSWKLTSNTTDRYRGVLDRLTAATGGTRAEATTSSRYEPERLIATSLECYAYNDATLDAAKALVAERKLGVLLDHLELQAVASVVVEELWRQLARPGTVYGILERPPVEYAALERLVRRMRVAAAPPLLDALVVTDDRTLRAKLLGLLAAVGDEAAPLAVDRLVGAPWYVQRNLLEVLARLQQWPSHFSPLAYVRHADARVRRPAMRLAMRVPTERDAAVALALCDSDVGMLRLGLAATGDVLPAGTAAVLRQRLAEPEFPAELRAAMLRALASDRTDTTLELLLRYVVAERRFGIGERLAAPTPEMLAALAGLAAHWRDDPRVRQYVRRASTSSDQVVRAVVGRVLAASA